MPSSEIRIAKTNTYMQMYIKKIQIVQFSTETRGKKKERGLQSARNKENHPLAAEIVVWGCEQILVQCGVAWYGVVWYGGPGQNIHVLCMEEPGHGTGTPPTIICGIKLVEMFRAVSRMQSERKSEKKYLFFRSLTHIVHRHGAG